MEPWITAAVQLLTGGWPVAVVIVALLYREEIKKLLPRIQKAGPVEFDPARQQEQLPPPNPQTIAQLDVGPPSQVVAELEARLTKDLDAYQPDKRQAALIRALAMSHTYLQHERVYAIILGSQMLLLKAMNPRELNEAEVRDIYETAKKVYPEIYESFTYESWIGFVENSELSTHEGDGFRITIKGRDFLSYLMQMGRPDKAS